MSIKLHIPQKDTKFTFKDVKVGETFLLGDYFYVKILPVIDAPPDPSEIATTATRSYNCFSLSNLEHYQAHDDNEIVRIDIDFMTLKPL